jgi:hypothetical protein
VISIVVSNQSQKPALGDSSVLAVPQSPPVSLLLEGLDSRAVASCAYLA